MGSRCEKTFLFLQKGIFLGAIKIWRELANIKVRKFSKNTEYIGNAVWWRTPEQAVEAAKKLQAETNAHLDRESQIHAGGRGKGKITQRRQRGVALAKKIENVQTIPKTSAIAGLVT